MSALLLPNEILSMSAQAARRLVEAGDGDGALLYLALLESGNDLDKARAQLAWDVARLQQTLARLAELGLAQAPGGTPAAAAPLTPREEDRPPEYTRGDIADALDREEAFRGLYRELERLLGRFFTDSDLKSLYTLYDYLALPVEVILLLASYVVGSSRRRKGPDAPLPRMSEVKKEAFRWKRLGIDTVERAEEYLRRQEQVDHREWAILSAVGVADRRPAVEKEREYIDRWVEMGVSDQLISMAYERTVFRKGGMNWPYMNKILQSWHQAGYRTPEDVRAGDKPPRAQSTPAAAKQKENYQPSRERIRKNADWLDKFLEEQEKGR